MLLLRFCGQNIERMCHRMKHFEFRMERPGLVNVGDRIEVRESVLKTLQGTMYYYTIHPAVAMSGNIPAKERLEQLEGVVVQIDDHDSLWTVHCEFEN